MKKFLTFLFLCLLTLSCVDEIRRPISSGAPHENRTEEIKAVPHLPVHIDSTGYMLHPIGELGDESGGYFSSGSRVSLSSDVILGRMTNLKFQDLNSEKIVALTNERVVIYSVQFLRSIFETTGKEFLLYTVLDKDSNGNEKLDSEDVRSLYISRISGENFRKLTPEGQHFLESTTVDEMNRLYFKSQEDSNEDGDFNNDERQHLFYIDLGSGALKVIEYDPLKE